MLTVPKLPARRSPPSRIAPVARVVRLLLALLVTVGVGACGDVTGLSRVEGTYALRSIDGQPLPATNGSVTLQSGRMTLDDDEWDMELRFTRGDEVDYGTYRRSGSSMEFESDIHGDFFDGALRDNNRTLLVEYDLGLAGLVLLEFRR